MHRERYYMGRFVARCRRLIPTTPLTPSRPCSTTPSTQTHIPVLAGRHRIPEVLRSEIQPRD